MRNLEIKNQNGRSMIEMLGVLAIIGVLSVGGIAGYSKAMQKYKINKTIEQITLIAGNIRAFFANQPEGTKYTDLYSEGEKAQILKKARLIPDEMWNGSKIENIFGGATYISYLGTSGNIDYRSFLINLGNIPQEACIELLTHDWSASGVYVMGNVSALAYGAKASHDNCETKEIMSGPYSFGYTYCGTSMPMETAIEFCKEVTDFYLGFH
ncbi:MAG: hypothetical protein IJ525_01580 [Alphaproteobacteria bacterium]|nr:hypothetical protein [Alphaproteobacteria bacterium]